MVLWRWSQNQILEIEKELSSLRCKWYMAHFWLALFISIWCAFIGNVTAQERFQQAEASNSIFYFWGKCSFLLLYAGGEG